MRWRLQCTVCAEKFVWAHAEPPDECPLCNAYIGADGKPTVAAPMISLAKNRTPDTMYRDMERGAQHRIEVAAELTGQDQSEFASMKMTNMKTGIREGDTTFVPHKPAVEMPVQMGRGVDPKVAEGLRMGPHQKAGAGQLRPLQQFHQNNFRQMNAAGEVRAGRRR